LRAVTAHQTVDLSIRGAGEGIVRRPPDFPGNAKMDSRKRSRIRFIGLLTLAAALAVAALPPIPQPQQYHAFADQRAWLGVPHFLNVVSNALFLGLGAAGLWRLAGDRLALIDAHERWFWGVFFFGIAATGLTSAYYHWAPDNAGLSWDRLTMAIAFMGWLAAHLAERVGVRAGLALLPALLLLGPGAVVYWSLSEAAGAGDLRPYGFMHFYPALLVPLLLWLFQPRYIRAGDVLAVLALYAAALVAERLDHWLFALTGTLSGHTLKHILAALAVYWALRMLQRRYPVGDAENAHAR
jgi:hypothetical protein